MSTTLTPISADVASARPRPFRLVSPAVAPCAPSTPNVNAHTDAATPITGVVGFGDMGQHGTTASKRLTPGHLSEVMT